MDECNARTSRFSFIHKNDLWVHVNTNNDYHAECLYDEKILPPPLRSPPFSSSSCCPCAAAPALPLDLLAKRWD